MVAITGRTSHVTSNSFATPRPACLVESSAISASQAGGRLSADRESHYSMDYFM